MNRTAALPCLLLFGLGGCNSSNAAPLPALSVSNPGANAPIVAEIVDRLCLRAVTDGDDFEAAVRRIGWPYRKTQSADRDTTLAVWQVPHGTLIYSERPTVAPDSDVWMCTFITDRAAAPPENVLAAALVHRLVGSGASPTLRAWHWRPSLLADADMTLTKGDSGVLNVEIDYAQGKPFRALFGK